MSRYEHATSISALMHAAKAAPTLSAETEVQLARLAAEGDQRAFSALVNAHLRLVVKIANEFRTFGLAIDELVGEGLLGLVVAARRFEAERGVRFAVYAAFWIRAHIRQCTITNRRIVRTPSTRHGRKLLANLRKTQRKLAQELGETPTAADVATALDVSVSEVEEMECALSGRDMPYGSPGEGLEFELCSPIPSPETLVARAEEQTQANAALQQALHALSERERRIVRERSSGDSSCSLGTIGRDLGLSRERVRQLEQQAHQKMRRAIMTHVA